jgi:hypothetical protein
MSRGRIATLLMGPQAGGRGYRVLARSDGPPISAAAEGRLGELALVVAGWADERETSAVALVPLADATAPAALLRLAYLGSGQLGAIAFAQGLLLDDAAFAACEGRPETLLPLIPPPDGSRDFAAAPLQLPDAPPPPPLRADWTGLGLEWRDRLVLVPDETAAEPILRSILAALGPASPGSRVRGWATTALMPATGALTPVDEFQLLVVDAGRRRPADLPHLPAYAKAGGFEGEQVAPSPAAQAFDRLKSLGGLDPDLAAALAPLRFSPTQFDAAPADLLRGAAEATLRRLPGGSGQMRLVIELARPRGDALDAACATVARGLLARLLAQPSLTPEYRAFYIKAVAEAPRDVAAALAPPAASLVSPGTGRWLRGRTFARLAELGWIEAAAARPEEAPALVEGLGPDELTILLDHVMLSADPALRSPDLISAALRRLADQLPSEGAAPTWGSMFEAGLRWRLGQEAGKDEARLGSRSVVKATHRLARPLMPRLSRRCLTLREGGDGNPALGLDRLAGALEWVKLEGRAA